MSHYNIDKFIPLLEKCKHHITNSKNSINVTEKNTSDFVTNIDFQIQTIIINFIKSVYPEDKIIAEETTIDSLTNKPTWVIDPIDGTVNFSYGSTLYGIQFCRVVNHITEFAVLYLPTTDDIYYAIKEQGAFKNNIKLQPLSNLPIRLSLVSFGDFSKSSYKSRPYEMKLIDILKEKVMKIRILGSSCIDFTSLASGQTHCHIMFSKRLWEFRPGLLLMKEAGLYTEEIRVPGTDIIAVCGAHNTELLEQVKQILDCNYDG